MTLRAAALRQLLFVTVVALAGVTFFTALVGWHYWGITPRPLMYEVQGKRFWGSRFEPRLEEMIAAGLELSETDDDGAGALHRAARYGTGDSVRVLIEAGMDIEAATRSGFRPMHLAVRAGRIDAVQILIDAGADIEARTEFGDTPLHLTDIAGYGPKTQAGRERALRVLLAAGADPNAQADNGLTALAQLASAYVVQANSYVTQSDNYPERLEAARALLDAGADPLIADRSGKNALDHARARGFDALAALLEAHIDAAPRH